MATVLLHVSLNVRFTTEQCLDDDIINSRPQQIHINAHLLKMFTKGTQRPLVPEIILLTRLIRNELIILLIDRVVRQVHELILLVDLLGVRF